MLKNALVKMIKKIYQLGKGFLKLNANKILAEANF